MGTLVKEDFGRPDRASTMVRTKHASYSLLLVARKFLQYKKKYL